MKKRLQFIAVLALLHIVTFNQTDDTLLSLQFIAQGSEFSEYFGVMQLSITNLLFNIAMVIMFISAVCKKISEAFLLHPYIYCRGGHNAVIGIMIKRAMGEVLFIITAKSLIYICFFIYAQDFTLFILYDLISTFLTLSMFSFIFILSKLSGAKDKIPLFCLIAGHMLVLIISYNVRVLSVFTISTIYWQEAFHFIIPIKIMFISILGVILLLMNKPNRILGVKD